MDKANVIGGLSELVERTVASAAGKRSVSGVSNRAFYGVFQRLSDEHHDIASQLERLVASSAIEKRAALWLPIRDMLLTHEQAELQEVYADFEWHPSLIDVVVDHDEDAGMLQGYVRRLDALTFDSPQWQPTLLNLQAIVHAHVEREEELYFPRVQAILGKDRAEELDARYVETRDALRRIG